jgi:serine/threonine protein kinase
MDAPASFGKYFLTEKIATGGMGEIYHGKLLGPGGFEKQLVIKQIHPDLASRREFVEMFVHEAKTMVSLSHGNIVPVYELGVVGGTYFIAMEYVDGPTLSELLRAARARGRRIDPPNAAFVCAEILKGVDYAHRKAGGVVHRDLSPRNVIVSRDGEVKILDFGLAATLDAAGEAKHGGRPAGSFPYMSPEQASRQPLDGRTDVFSAGILLWEMIVGAPLFQRSDDEATLEAVRAAEVPPPSSRVQGPKVPPELEAACLRALEKDRDRRWGSASEFLSALTRFLYSVEPSITQASVSRLVAELCPDAPRRGEVRVSAEPAAGDGAGSPSDGDDVGPRTKPMSRRPPTANPADPVPAPVPDQESFATNADFERVLTKVASERSEKSEKPETPDESPDRMSAAVAAASSGGAPRRRGNLVGVVAVGALLAAGAVAFVLVTSSGGATRNAATVSIDAAPQGGPRPDPSAHLAFGHAGRGGGEGHEPPFIDAAPVRTAVVDAGVVAIAPPPDAAPVIKKPLAKGKLTVATPDVTWAQVYIDGKFVKNTPLGDYPLTAEEHLIRVVCVPDVCGEERTRSQKVIVRPGEVTRLDLKLR